MITTKKRKLTKKQREAYAIVGSLGGQEIAKRGKKYMKKIGKAGAEARWGKKTAIIK